MSLFFGNNEIDDVFVGNNEIASIFVGNNEVWSSFKMLPLGTGTTFNVGQLYPTLDLTQFTVDDFFFNSFSCSASATASCARWDDTGILTPDHCLSGGAASVTTRMNKSWNSNTGILTCNYNGNSCKAYLIPRSNDMISKGKLVNLGTSTTFDVRNIPTYPSMTINNFVFRTLPNVSDSMDWCYSRSCPVGVSWNNSYSSANGTLSAYFSRYRLGNHSINAFCIPKL